MDDTAVPSVSVVCKGCNYGSAHLWNNEGDGVGCHTECITKALVGIPHCKESEDDGYT